MVDAIRRINRVTQIPGLIPLANMLAEGQIAINAADGKLYIRLLAGNVICVGQDVGVYADAIGNAIDGLDIEAYALAADVAASMADLGQQLQDLAILLAGKAPSAHGHAITDVSGLQTALNGKQPAGNYAAAAHGHAIGEVSGLQTALDGKAGIGGVTGAFVVGNNFAANVIAANNHISAGTTFRIGTNNVIRVPNQQGWQNPTGPQSTAAFNSSSVTLNDLARRVAAIQTQLIYHGLLSTQGATIT